MKVAVLGLWHLGSVTAACLAQAGFDVLAYDPRSELRESMKAGVGPVSEPGLDALIQATLSTKKLSIIDALSSIQEADVVWVTYDTPVDDHDVADTAFVVNHVKQAFVHMKDGATLLISSQLPVGSTASLRDACRNAYPDKQIHFAYSPENLRLGQAIQVFTHPDRIVIGIDKEQSKAALTPLLSPFSDRLLWMRIESAEMTKHAINAFLATSVVFANELATLCEQVGALSSELEQGLKSESRIGPKAYLRAGSAFAGGTLARDVNYLIALSEKHHVHSALFPAILASNDAHKRWVQEQITKLWADLKGKNLCVLGLSYKPLTNTLVRSSAIALCEWLHEQGASVCAYEPMLNALPDAYSGKWRLESSMEAALRGADAVIITKSHEQFEYLSPETLLSVLSQPYVFDESGFYKQRLAHHESVTYFCLGGAA